MTIKGLATCLSKGVGVESEYMLVDCDSLAPAAIADKVLDVIGGKGVSEVAVGDVRISNESTLHQIEVKTNGPAVSLARYVDAFNEAVASLNTVARGFNCRLLPSAMHPFLKPEEVRFWHEDGASDLYSALGSLFNRRSHGWANIQSTHINFPYADEQEFRLLHSCIRVIIPLIPALCASSPVVEGVLTGYEDSRLNFYRGRRAEFKTLCPNMVPEVVRSTNEYQDLILAPAYAEVGARCPSGILNQPWINDRGAIGRIDRGTIEIRILDSQECPLSDLATVSLVRAAVVLLSRRVPLEVLEALDCSSLEPVFKRCVELGGAAEVSESDYVRALGINGAAGATANDLWRMLFDRVAAEELLDCGFEKAFNVLLNSGTLAKRISSGVRKSDVLSVYRELASLLAEGGLYNGG